MLGRNCQLCGKHILVVTDAWELHDLLARIKAGFIAFGGISPRDASEIV